MLGLWRLSVLFASLAADVLNGDDSRLYYVGRHSTDAGRSSSSFDWVGSGVLFRVRGAGNVTVDFDAKGLERFSVYSRAEAAPRQLVADFFASEGRQNCTIANLRGDKSRLVYFIKSSEPRPRYLGGKGPATLYSMSLSDSLQVVPLEPGDISRRIDFYGDSDSASFGVDGTAGAPECSGASAFKQENFADGWITGAADQLSVADVHVQAVSGIGVVKNAEAGAASASGLITLPKLIKRTLQSEDKEDYNGSSWRPDVVVVYVGSNDYVNLKPPSKDVFSSTYEAMVREILSTAGWSSPPPVVHVCGGEKIPCDYIRSVSDKLNSTGLTSIYTATGDTGIKKGGCDGHRNITQQAALARYVAPVISSAAGWSLLY